MNDIVVTTNTALWGLFLLGIAGGALLTSCLLVPTYRLGRREGKAEQALKNTEER